MNQKPQTALRCLFCGKGLKEAKRGAFSCPGCGARLHAEVDKEGCIIGLTVQDCGTPDCCRHTQGSDGKSR